MLDLSIARVKLEPLAESLVERTPIETWPLLAGWISFGSSCAASTFCQKMVGISTGTRPPLPTALGMATVCAASMISHQAAIAIHLEMERWKNSRRHLKPSPSLWQRLSPEIRDKFDVPREFQSFLHSVKDNWKGDSIDLGGLVQTPKHKLRM